MQTIKEFLLAQGYSENLIDKHIPPENYLFFDLEYCEGIYRSNLAFMQKDFDEWFVIEMLAQYSCVFMSSSLQDKLQLARAAFGTDMWSSFVQYEYDHTGHSTLFELIDSLVIGAFETKLANVCKKIRSLWEEDYCI